MFNFLSYNSSQKDGSISVDGATNEILVEVKSDIIRTSLLTCIPLWLYLHVSFLTTSQHSYLPIYLSTPELQAAVSSCGVGKSSRVNQKLIHHWLVFFMLFHADSVSKFQIQIQNYQSQVFTFIYLYKNLSEVSCLL
jgi:hypothetical protein